MKFSRWSKLCDAAGLTVDPGVFDALERAYTEPHRHYHGVGHITDCLARLDEVSGEMKHPLEVEFALWFHDAVYDTHAGDNELKSAEWAHTALSSGGASGSFAQRVHDAIMATAHNAVPAGETARWVVDIDLSILGREEHEYDRFETAVRKEYTWVPGLIFKTKRARILKSFLQRPYIYQTRHFRDRFEDQARINLKRAIAALAGRGTGE